MEAYSVQTLENYEPPTTFQWVKKILFVLNVLFRCINRSKMYSFLPVQNCRGNDQICYSSFTGFARFSSKQKQSICSPNQQLTSICVNHPESSESHDGAGSQNRFVFLFSCLPTGLLKRSKTSQYQPMNEFEKFLLTNHKTIDGYMQHQEIKDVRAEEKHI